MARRTQVYTKLPWTGGLNDAVDSGVLSDNDLVIADNVIFATSGSRLKREGLSYFDQLDLPPVTSVSRSGTTVTVTFSANIQTASNDIFVVGEKITVVTEDSQFNATDVAVGSIPAANQITYTVGAPPTAATATFTSLSRTSKIVGLTDFWYFVPANNAKTQAVIAVTSQGKFYRYDVNGNRKELANKTYAVTFQGAGDTVTLNAHGLLEGDAIGFTSITTTTGISVDTVYFVGGTITANTFQLSATRGGSVLPLTSDGSGVGVSPLFTAPITRADFAILSEKCLIALSGTENYPKIFDPQTSTSEIRGAFGAAPNASFARVHQSRMWLNNKDELDRLYYSSPFNVDEYSGYGDSGVLDIGIGDGDPEGLSATFPPFKNTLFVTKRNTTYRVDGTSPDDYSIQPVSTGLGGAAHESAVGVGLDDVLYMSHKGIHSLAATNSYGDFTGAFLSEKIQNAFKSWTTSRFSQAVAAYVPNLNTVFFGVPTADFDTQGENDSLWCFNTKFKEWHRWPDVIHASLGVVDISGEPVLLIGGTDGRISRAQNGNYTDYEDTGINFKIKTGTIYVDGSPISVKAFKRLGFLFRPTGNFSFTVKVKIDNYPLQPLTFSQVSGADELGSTFILGTSTLASANTMAPHTLPIDGYGRGITLEIEQSAVEQPVEIYGIMIEFESADIKQETIGGEALKEAT